VLISVFQEAGRDTLSRVREIPSVKRLDPVYGAYDAIASIEGEQQTDIEATVESIHHIRGVKEAKPLIEADPPVT
jgi:hypothetical protein